ncbi:MAG: alpha/beta hydrolase [Sulfurospirillaceae bacterium]|nr:alpha/beta hydrolase [Sulfurospirillaceae bacterium]
MVKTLILHGWGGSDFPHWQSYLACELAKDYGTVSFPLLIDKDNPKKDTWMKQVRDILSDFKPDIVVCHSLANTLWFHLCNEEKITPVKKLFLVAPPSLTTEVEEVSTFFPVSAPQNIYAQEIILITSTNDPYMPNAEANDLAKQLDVKHLVLKDAGHINAESGFGEWSDINLMVKGLK